MEKGQLRPPVLVFVQEKDRAKDLFNELIKEKIHHHIVFNVVMELIEGKEEEELSIDDQALSLEGCAVQRKRKV